MNILAQLFPCIRVRYKFDVQVRRQRCPMNAAKTVLFGLHFNISTLELPLESRPYHGINEILTCIKEDW